MSKRDLEALEAGSVTAEVEGESGGDDLGGDELLLQEEAVEGDEGQEPQKKKRKKKKKKKGKKQEAREALDFAQLGEMPDALAHFFAASYAVVKTKPLEGSKVPWLGEDGEAEGASSSSSSNDDKKFDAKAFAVVKDPSMHQFERFGDVLKDYFGKKWAKVLCPGNWQYEANQSEIEEAARVKAGGKRKAGGGEGGGGGMDSQQSAYARSQKEAEEANKSKRAKKKEGKFGAPAVVVVCPSALRCIEVYKALSEMHRRTRVHKLFARHIKVQEQVEALKQPVGIVVGTPARMAQLAKLGALKNINVKLVVLDMGRDTKQMTLLDIKDTRASFMDMYESEWHKRVLEGRTQIMLLQTQGG